jgi:lipoprotein-anchoring transpeptidase ErfK/SrfK
MRIDIDLSKKVLLVRNGDNADSKGYDEILLEADIVSGCEGNNTPTGKFRAGKFIKDKTNPKYGVVSWSKDPWGNPYGPYFLQILNLKGIYTTYGIHGTRGFGGAIGVFEKPPIPQWMLGIFIEEDAAKYSYCSHGCIRVSNSNIAKLFSIVTKHRSSPNTKIYIYITKESVK